LMDFISNIIWNSVEGFVEAGTRTAGGYAGDALIRAGDLIESSGRSVGNKLERTASSYGSKVSGQASGPPPGTKALPSAKKPTIKRSNSSPAATKGGTTIAPNTSKVPIGANKYPGGKHVSGAVGTGTKQTTSGVWGAKSTATKGVGGAGGVVKGGTKGLPKPYPNNKPYGTSKTPADTKSKVSDSKKNGLPKPYPGTSTYPGSGKKTAVKPGQRSGSKGKDNSDGPKPYPGPNTLPGQGKKVPVQRQNYKPIKRMKPQVEKGMVQHIAVG
ncbi:hypothetical protein K469DRAFT_545793, partial [Zopfia rhizophila CBS 207.26]